MKANEKLLSLFVIAVAFNTVSAKAQLFSNISIGANGGAYVYQGDLAPSGMGSLKTTTAGFNIYAQKALSDYLSFRFNVGIAKLRGDESKYSSPAYRQQRNFMFSTPLKELSGLILWNIKGSNFSNNGAAPYLLSGITFSFLRTQIDYSRLDTSQYKDPTVFANIARDVNHGTPRVIPVIPIGGGVEFPLSQKLFLTTEASYRFSFTDYIDGFSLAAGPDKKDHYYSATIGLRYRFNNNDDEGSGKGNKTGCPANVY
ncbi:DUF6089 family protein [Ferruginibacter lapsinanis]|uniref:DUF6089 family protein n=1 Tax=Ferruginibacter lapsinanis TaxID=563172 RepID=UPI001E4E71E7|nr:DUF6089 family protein [Ferruginibacter lapsinanis]UEG49150.1 DUF6089 family protein [Ferruginibacter lapsinanis]